MSRQEIYGNSQSRTPSNLDWVLAVNEDLGFNASLVTGTNETFETTIPYPQEWDPENEVMTIYELTHAIQRFGGHQDDQGFHLTANLSMIDRSAAATYIGDLADADDEWIKSVFARGMKFGNNFFTPTVGTGANLVALPLDLLTDAVYRPKLPIPAFFPVYDELVNQSVTIAATTGDETLRSFTEFEKVIIEYDYTIRKMSRTEQNFFQGLPGMQQRWAQLGS